MNNRIKTLKNQMNEPLALIYDKYNIDYLINQQYDVGERFIALLIRKDQEPILFLNKLFEAPNNVKTIVLEDHHNFTEILQPYLNKKDVGVDGNMPARFILPFIKLGYTMNDISKTINRLRNIKDNDELKNMRKASKLNDEIMHKIRDSLKIGVSEKEIADIINELQNTKPLSGESFPGIALFSENIADPHGIPTDRKLKDGDAVLIDMGGIYNTYCSDMTRCFFVGENDKLKNLYKIVLEANEKAIAAVKPGMRLSEIDKIARDVIENAGYGEFYIHRTGHGIGKEAHEFLDVSSSSNEIIQAGMCFSIEPGIYIKDVGGIRIEDIVCVTENGVEVLNSFPKNIDEVTL